VKEKEKARKREGEKGRKHGETAKLN